MITSLPNSQYYLVYQEYKAVIRALNGYDLEIACTLDLNTLSGQNALYKKLLIKESEPIENLDLDLYTEILKGVNSKVFKYLLKPQDWLDIIYVVGGRAFSPNWKDWKETVIEDLIAMAEVAKRLEKTF